MNVHGLSRYRKGCRCLTCRAAVSQRNSASYRQRMTLRVTGENGRPLATTVEHGAASAYSQWGCRCEPCSLAWSRRLRERRAEGKSS